MWMEEMAIMQQTQSLRRRLHGKPLHSPTKHILPNHKPKLLTLFRFRELQNLAIEFSNFEGLIVLEPKIESGRLEGILNPVLPLEHPLDSYDGFPGADSWHVSCDLVELAAEIPC
jgi:hypothetical protein